MTTGIFAPPSMAIIYLLSFCAALLVTPSDGNQMDPHVYPANGPFFEGWYLRLTDREQNATFGFLFGLVLPKTSDNRTATDNPLLCMSLLVNPPTATKLGSPTECFDPSGYTVLKNGKPVTHNPDDETPPNFEVRLGQNLKYIVTPTSLEFSASIGNHTLEGVAGAPVPWGPHGEGPESYLEKLPLPIHWFVYSLRSVVSHYSYTDSAKGISVKGGSGRGLPVVAHVEKNWGPSFPEAWVWAEGVDSSTGVSFAVSSGLLREVFLDIPAQLSGYRNPMKNISCSFHPLNSVHSLRHNACDGLATVEVTSATCHIVFRFSAAPRSFSECLVTPQTDGFRTGCLESFTATADIKATANGVTDHQIVSMAALEFGGKFMCKGKCP